MQLNHRSEREVPREFGDAAEAVGNRNGDSGFGSLFSIKFELDFHYRVARVASINRR